MSRAPEIPKRRHFEPIEIVLPPSASQAQNIEVRSETATKGLILVAFVNVLMYPLLLFAGLYIAAGTMTHPVVWLPTLALGVWRYTHHSQTIMLILSGDFVANKTREDEFKLRDKSLDMMGKASDREFDLQWAKLTQDGEVRIQELLNDNKVAEAQSTANYWKSKAAVHHTQQTAQLAPPVETDALTVADVGLLFTDWLELAYSECSESGNVGTEPWSESGDWTEEESNLFKKHLLPKLKTTDPPVVLKSRQTGNRMKLNLSEWPSCESALEAMEGLW